MRTRSSCVPAVACHCQDQSRHASVPMAAARLACSHGPPSTLTSTEPTPVCWCHARPPTATVPAAIRVPTTLLGVAEDQLVPLADMRQLRDQHGGNCSLTEISSIYGHDAFLKETEVLRDLLARALD